MATRATFQTASMGVPSRGSLALPIVFNLSEKSVVEVDTLLEQESGAIDFFQSVWIDNSENENQFELQFPGGFDFSIKAAPFSQGFYPITIANGVARIIASGGDTDVPTIFYNFAMPYFQWNVTGASGGGGDVATGIETNHSLILSGVSQTIIPANADRLRAVIQVPSNNLNSIHIAIGIPATADYFSQEIMPGQEYDTSAGPLPLADINIIGTAAETIFASEIHK